MKHFLISTTDIIFYNFFVISHEHEQAQGYNINIAVITIQSVQLQLNNCTQHHISCCNVIS